MWYVSRHKLQGVPLFYQSSSKWRKRNSIVRCRWLAWARLLFWPLAMSLCFSSPVFNSSTMLTFCQVFVCFSLTLLWAKPVWFLCLFGLLWRPKAGRVYKAQAPVIQTLDNAIYRIFIYLLRFGNSKQGHYGRPVKVPPPPLQRLIRDRPPHPGLRPLLFTNHVRVLQYPTEFICATVVRRGHGLSSLSEKTIKYNRLQMFLQRQHSSVN